LALALARAAAVTSFPLVGPLCWLIRSAGLVSWDDLFDGNGDPRDFDQVAGRASLVGLQFVGEGVAWRGGRGPLQR
jgi:hypothetical protein